MNFSLKKLIMSALCLALGLVLPSFFHMFGAGTVFLPMHIPVLLCGLICGAPYGAAVGIVLPFISSAITGMPPIFPTAVAMCFELCTYGLVSGMMYRRYQRNIYLSLVAGMLAGRGVSGIANAVILGAAGQPYGFGMFVTASFVTSIPGIIIQLVLIPLIVTVLLKAGVISRTDRPDTFHKAANGA
jgi:predicted membrane protein